MEMEWWMWLVIGLVLATLEIITLSFFILWFGLGALLVSLLSYVVPELSIASQVLAWAVLSSLMAAIWFKAFKSRSPDSRWTADDVLGEMGLLTASVAEFQKGRVRFQKPILGNEEWVCISNAEIPSGARVRLVAIEGNTARVEKV